MTSSKKVIIVGSSGFIGRYLTRSLLSQDYRVTTINRSPLSDQITCGSFSFDDIESISIQKKLFRDVHSIVYLSGIAHTSLFPSIASWRLYETANILKPCRIATIAGNYGSPLFIYISSAKVFEAMPLSGRSRFSDVVQNCQDLYTLSKYIAESKLQELALNMSLRLLVIRPPLVYGPNVAGNLKLIHNILSKNIPLPLGSINTNMRSFISIYNLCHFIEHCLSTPDPHLGIYPVSDGITLSTSAFIRLYAQSMNKGHLVVGLPKLFIRLVLRLLNRSALSHSLHGSLSLDISQTCNDFQWEPPLSCLESLKLSNSTPRA